jgi:hypothetical protein
MRRVRLLAGTAVVGLALVACSADGDGEDAATESGELAEPAEAAEFDEDGAAGEQPQDESGAGDEAASEGDAESAGAEAADPATVDQTSIQAAEQGRHVIYNVDLLIETENLARSTQQAIALAESAGGFVSREDTHGDTSATLTLRVPADDHASIVKELENLGEVAERSRHAEDVTSEVVDVNARIQSQERSIARIRELLDEAGDLSDIVSIESELARREANLDSLLSRQAELGSLTTLATITVTFEQVGESDNNDDGEDPTFLSGLESGWSAFVSAVTYVSAGFGALLPFLAVAAVAGAPFLVLRRRRNAEGAKLVE